MHNLLAKTIGYAVVLLVATSSILLAIYAAGRLSNGDISYPYWILIIGFCLFLYYEHLTQDGVVRWPWLLVIGTALFWSIMQVFILPGFLPNLLEQQIFESPLQEGLVVRPVGYNLSESIHYIGLFFSYMAIAFITSRIKRSMVILLLAFWSVHFVFQLAYGFYVRDPGVSVLGVYSKVHGGATGTYVHPNHYGGYIALSTPLVLVFITYFLRKLKLFGIVLSPIQFAVAGAALYMLFLSGSRVAIVEYLLVILVLSWVLLGYLSGRKIGLRFGSRIVLIMTIFLGAAALLFLTDFNPEQYYYQFMRIINNPYNETRFAMWRNIMQFEPQTWILGVGPGVFQYVYPQVFGWSADTTRVLSEAHNDYLQFVLEFGVIGALLMAVAFIVLIVKYWPKGKSVIRLGAWCGMLAIAIHSVVDFNLQIPANAMFFWAAFGLTLNPWLTNDAVASDYSKQATRSAYEAEPLQEEVAESTPKIKTPVIVVSEATEEAITRYESFDTKHEATKKATFNQQEERGSFAAEIVSEPINKPNIHSDRVEKIPVIPFQTNVDQAALDNQTITEKHEQVKSNQSGSEYVAPSKGDMRKRRIITPRIVASDSGHEVGENQHVKPDSPKADIKRKNKAEKKNIISTGGRDIEIKFD